MSNRQKEQKERGPVKKRSKQKRSILRGKSKTLIHFTTPAWCCFLTGHCRRELEAASYLEANGTRGVLGSAAKKWALRHGEDGIPY